MTLTNLTTVTTKTATTTSRVLVVPADRFGLGCGAGHAYPADILSQGHFPTPRNPVPDVGAGQGQSAAQLRKQMRAGGPVAVPPSIPGSRAAQAAWPLLTGESRRANATGRSRSRHPKACVIPRLGRDCQSPDRSDEKHALERAATPATAAGK